MKKIRWGIIGCGDVTERKSGPAFSKVADSELVAVMRRSAEGAEDYAVRHKVPRWYINADALINDEEVNAIYVATPPSTHADYAIRAMRAGKAVYVEKPMAATYAQCQQMLQVSEETAVPLFVAYYRRSLPEFLAVKKVLDEGAIGRPLLINIRLLRPALDNERAGASWRVDPKVAGGGLFYDLASHQLDLVSFLFGKILEASGSSANFGGRYAAEDTVVASFETESGVMGSAAWSFVAGDAAQEDSMELIGTKGKVVFSGFGHRPPTLFNEKGEQVLPFTNPENIQYYLIEQVVQTLLGKGSCVSMGASAADTNRVMEMILGRK